MEINAKEATFDTEVLSSPIPVIVDFWAQWCVPCRMVSPILKELSDDYEGKIKLVKVNVDEEGELASRYNIISIPTLMIFNKGEVAAQHVGASSKEAIEKLFTPFL